MEKIEKLIKAFGLSILFILLGFYLINSTDTILGKVIGIASISFFGILILWGIFRIFKNYQ